MKVLNPILMLAVLSLITTSCAKQKEPPKGSTTADLKTSITEVSANSSGTTTGNSIASNNTDGKVICANPIKLEDDLLKPIVEKSDMPDAQYKLVHLQMHMIYEGTGNSYTAIAKESEGFDVALQCNGMKNFSELDAEEELTSSFTSNIAFGAFTAEGEDYQRFMEVNFRSGILTSSISELRPSDTNRVKLDRVPMERMEVGTDTFITVRVYAVTCTKVEVRSKIEFPAKDGKRNILFAKAVYKVAK